MLMRLHSLARLRVETKYENREQKHKAKSGLVLLTFSKRRWGLSMFDIKLAAHLAELSKLNFTDEELVKITNDMDSIVALMDTVRDFDAEDLQSEKHPLSIQELRQDEGKDSIQREDVLSNAKKREGAFFSVPKVV